MSLKITQLEFIFSFTLRVHSLKNSLLEIMAEVVISSIFKKSQEIDFFSFHGDKIKDLTKKVQLSITAR